MMKTSLFGRLRETLALFLVVSCASAAFGGSWPRLLGPNHDCRVAAEDSAGFWKEGGLQKAWEFPKGKGWAPPVVEGDSVFLFHRQGREEVLECIGLSSGKSLWRYSYEAPYRDRYGSGDGARTSPVIADGKVWVFGITGLLHCLNAKSGALLWKRDLGQDYAMQDNFFGHGSTPLVLDGKVILPVGGSQERCAVALDAGTGTEVWVTKHPWGAGYASAIPARIGRGKVARDCVLLFTGGETRPPTGGLLCLDASDGAVLGEVAHRARIAESVNAASPVLVEGNKVLTTEAYGSGSVLCEIQEDGRLQKIWGTLKLGSQFVTPLWRDGLVLGFDGQNIRLAELVCLDAVTGEERWRDDLGGSFGRGNLVDLGENGVLALGETGELVRFRPGRDKLEVLQRVRLFEAPETWSIPVLAGRHLLVMQNERAKDGATPRLICYTY
jgi:outer membrane protein assembly factor BamB